MKYPPWQETGRYKWDEETLKGMTELYKFPAKDISSPEDRAVATKIRKNFFTQIQFSDYWYLTLEFDDGAGLRESGMFDVWGRESGEDSLDCFKFTQPQSAPDERWGA